jgi:hypothetical protein
MKLNKTDVYDRFTHFTNQEFDVGECCQDLINQRPFGDHPFYIFAHARTKDDGVTKVMIWQPRLTKPRAEPNSMLFRAYPGTDVIKVIWMIPARELWGQFDKGMITQNKTVIESIDNFRHRRSQLEAKEDDDLSDEAINAIYREISIEARKKQTVDEKVEALKKNMAVMPKGLSND